MHLFDRRKNVYLQSITMASSLKYTAEELKLFKQLVKKIEENEDALLAYRAVYYMNFLKNSGEKV